MWNQLRPDREDLNDEFRPGTLTDDDDDDDDHDDNPYRPHL